MTLKEEKKFELDNQHWQAEEYTQRITTKELQQMFLGKQEHIIFQGHMRNIGYRKVAPGIYEIFKKPYV
jgi:hypothetical protein